MSGVAVGRGAPAIVAVMTCGCIFAPNVAPAGYTSCASDDDCAAGRFCEESLCAPPPWRDKDFTTRHTLIVENTSDLPVPAGAAVPVRVGGEGALLQLADIGVDFRFGHYDHAAAAWSEVAVYLDRERDRFTAWLPLQHELAPGRKAALAWIEHNTLEQLPVVLEDPGAAFRAYDAFDDALAAPRWFTRGTPRVQDGVVNVGDNQVAVLSVPLVPPVLVQAIARLNGTTCGQVFLGLVGDDRAILEVPPSAGVFVGTDLAAQTSVAPTADSVPTPVGESFTAPTRFSRWEFAVDEGAVRVALDGVTLFSEIDLRPPFSSAPLFFAVQVGGACSVDVDAIWASPLPQPLPKVVAEPPVNFDLSLDG
jgi:hypothetical protein